jgi:tetratricopeptide (TPR) repeat protein
MSRLIITGCLVFVSLFSIFGKDKETYDFSKPENIIAFLFEIKNLPDSVSLASKSIFIKELLPNPSGTLRPADLAMLYFLDGKIYQEQEIWEKAIASFYQSLEIAQSNGLQKQRALAKLEIGAVLLEKESFEEAEKHITNGLSFLKNTDAAEELPRAYFLAAKLLTSQGKVQDAIPFMIEAINGFNLDANFKKGADIALEYGLQLSNLGMLEKSNEFLKSALFHFRMEEEKAKMGQAYLYLTENNLKAGDFQDALINNQQALTIFKKELEKEKLALIHWNFALIFKNLAKTGEAKTHLDKTLNYLKSSQPGPEIYTLFLKVSDLYQKMGEPEKANNTYQYLAKNAKTWTLAFRDKEVLDISKKYETVFQTQEYSRAVEKLNMEKSAAHKTAWFLVVILLLIFFLAVVGYAAFLQKRTLVKALEKKNKEIERQAQELAQNNTRLNTMYDQLVQKLDKPGSWKGDVSKA